MISLKSVNYSYKNQPPLFENLSIDLVPGKIIGLLGKNGSGKTSLLKLISGLLFQKSGDLTVLDHQPRNRSPFLLENIFLIPEEIYLPAITIDQYIKANSPFYPKFDLNQMADLLEECELFRNQSIQALSFGQKKKFLITFALATKCKLLLLDEPTNGLDIPSKGVFRKMVAGSLDQDQLVIVSTHQVKDVENLIDSVLILDSGAIILNMDIDALSSQLQFTKRKSLDGMQVLYSEETLGGYNVISRETTESSSIDMELLFNAVTSGKPIF